MVEATCAPIWGTGVPSQTIATTPLYLPFAGRYRYTHDLLPLEAIPSQPLSHGFSVAWVLCGMGSLWHGFSPQANGTHTFPATLTRCLLTTCGEVWSRGLKLALTTHIPWGGLKTTTFQQPRDPLMSSSTSRAKWQRVS